MKNVALMFLTCFKGDVEVFFLLDLTEQDEPAVTAFVGNEAIRTALSEPPLVREVSTIDKHNAMIEATKKTRSFFILFENRYRTYFDSKICLDRSFDSEEEYNSCRNGPSEARRGYLLGNS